MDMSGESKKGRTVDAWAPEGDERRGKLRKAAGRCRQPLIRGFLNGATQRTDGPLLIQDEGKRWELKHLSTSRKRKQNVIPPVVASERGRAQTSRIPVRLGL